MSRDFKIGVIATIYYPASHADVIVSRWLEPFPEDAEWGWTHPQSRIASLYVEQFPDKDVRDAPPDEFVRNRYRVDVDLARFIAEKHDIPLYDSVREALTLSGDSLTVDSVLLIGEHGEYPFNDLRQKLYPRKELFDAIIAVFREAGRGVPIFCDKHLSWNPEWALEMYRTAQEMEISFFAGSSLPFVGIIPPFPEHSSQNAVKNVERQAPNIQRSPLEYVGLFYVGAEAYGFHSLELMQSLIESRPGGETGICRVTAYIGDEVEKAMNQGLWSRELFEAALEATSKKNPGDWRENCREASTYEGTGNPIALVFEHADGFKSAHILLAGHLQDFTCALRLRDSSIVAGRCADGGESSFYGHFATLNSHIERFFLTGKPPIPPERTLLTTLAIAA